MPMPGPPTPQATAQGAATGGLVGVSLKGRALRLLSAREHSRAELVRKLAPHETTPGELDRALDELQAKGFISEARVVESVVHRRAARVGAARIRHELQGKGLAPEVIEDAMADLHTTELTRATEVWRKKFGELPTDAAARGKQMRFLAARGFGAEVIHKVLSRSGRHTEPDDAGLT